MSKDRVILAIDYGTRRIGLAWSQVGLAEPLKVIANDPGAIEEITQICHQKGVKLILVGLSEGRMAQKTKKFVQQLKAELEAPIKLTDETLSTQEARQKLVKAQAKQKKRKGPVDHFAAASFLQNWLQTHP
jgi:putative Holliday junction resolvase